MHAFYAKHVSTLQLKSLDGPTRGRARAHVRSSICRCHLHRTCLALPDATHAHIRTMNKNQITTHSFPLARFVISPSSWWHRMAFLVWTQNIHHIRFSREKVEEKNEIEKLLPGRKLPPVITKSPKNKMVSIAGNLHFIVSLSSHMNIE